MVQFLLNTDQQHAVLGGVNGQSRAYSPYGLTRAVHPPGLAFAGMFKDPLTGHYPLGNGHRFYSPSLMRFLSADSLSPFDRGGMNAYAYCLDDPVNRIDPSGRFPAWITHTLFGASAMAGTANMIVSRMRARINRVPLPDGASEPILPNLHRHVISAANTFDTYAYTVSMGIRPVHFAAPSHPSLLTAAGPALEVVDAARASGGLLGFAALPLNARHEWLRAGVRGMHRGRLLGEAISDAYGVSYAWQAARAAGSAVGHVVSGVWARMRDAIRGRPRAPSDIEAQAGNYPL